MRFSNDIKDNGTIGNSFDYHGLEKCLESTLKEYLEQSFLRYKYKNMAVQTPQLLLLLLSFPDTQILNIFNACKPNGREPYGTCLVNYFRSLNGQYKNEGRVYRDAHWQAFLQYLEQAKDVLDNQTAKNSITANILCFAILSNEDSTTVQMIRKHLGKDYESLKKNILNDRLLSIPVYPKQ